MFLRLHNPKNLGLLADKSVFTQPPSQAWRILELGVNGNSSKALITILVSQCSCRKSQGQGRTFPGDSRECPRNHPARIA